MSLILEVEGLHVSYGAVEALVSVDLTVEAGEVVTVLGANGAGKSSLLNSIIGLVPSSKGAVRFRGTDVTNWKADTASRAGVVLVPEGRRIFSGLSVEENLLLGGYFVRGEEYRQRVEEMFDVFPVLKDRRSSFAGHLSGGEQQMLAIARGLMSAPQLLLLDEPSAGLAPIIVRNVYRTVAEYVSHTGATILLVEQNVHYALNLASRGYVLELGRIKLAGSASEFRSDPRVADLYLGQQQVRSAGGAASPLPNTSGGSQTTAP